MQLDAAKAQLDSALQLGSGVLEILLHGGKADELGVRLALLRDEVVDGGDGVRGGGNGVHDEVRDGRAVLRCKQAVGRAIAEHVNVVEVPDGLHGLRGDFVGIDMRMRIDNGHNATPHLETSPIVRQRKAAFAGHFGKSAGIAIMLWLPVCCASCGLCHTSRSSGRFCRKRVGFARPSRTSGRFEGAVLLRRR